MLGRDDHGAGLSMALTTAPTLKRIVLKLVTDDRRLSMLALRFEDLEELEHSIEYANVAWV